MKQEDFEEYIQTLHNKQFETSRKPSAIVNNFYSLITIVIISIAIIIYVNYVVPAQQANKIKTEHKTKS
ncbi:MAG: hypothetical protein KAQ94_02855 [Arcobacteraceae bacterium]|nr:hypothetical protein [Arcobacteraceae bacterium]